MMRLMILLGLILSLAACSGERRRKNMTAFDGQYFKARASSERQDRRDFSVAVAPVSASLAGAREAGRHEAVKHCLRYYGSSDMDWTAGPDAEEAQLQISEDTLTLTGRCMAR